MAPDTDYIAAGNIRFHTGSEYSVADRASGMALSLSAWDFAYYTDTDLLVLAGRASGIDFDLSAPDTASAVAVREAAEYIEELASAVIASSAAEFAAESQPVL